MIVVRPVAAVALRPVEIIVPIEVTLPTGAAVPVAVAVLPVRAVAVVPAEGTYPADQQKEAHLQKVREATATEVLLPVLQKEEAAQEDKTYSFIIYIIAPQR